MEEEGLYEKTWLRQTKNGRSLSSRSREQMRPIARQPSQDVNARRWLFQSIVKVVAMHPSTQYAYNADQAALNQPGNQ